MNTQGQMASHEEMDTQDISAPSPKYYGKGKRPMEGGDLEERPTKRQILHHPRPVTLSTLHQFLGQHTFCQWADLKYRSSAFLGLCAYLHIAVSWGSPVPEYALDDFIISYSTWLAANNNAHAPTGYHAWYMTAGVAVLQAQWQQYGRPYPQVLDFSTLDAIVQENPYTYKYTQQTMEVLIAV